jgi:hypothetical protein
MREDFSKEYDLDLEDVEQLLYKKVTNLSNFKKQLDDLDTNKELNFETIEEE